MGVWQESLHPRDDEGKFTYKNGGNSSSSSADSEREKLEHRAYILYGGVEKNNYEYNLVDAKKKEIADRHEKLEQGTFPPHQLKNLIGVNFIQNPIIRGGAKFQYGNEAAENLYMSKKGHYLDTDYARQHLVFNNYKEVNSEFQPYLKKKISEQIGKDKLETTKGIYIDSDSSSSKRIAQALIDDTDFSDILDKNMKNLQNGIPFESTINFKGKNLHNALGNADLLDIKKNKRGEIEMIVADTYDFNKNDINDLVRIGREQQEAGKIIPYFIMYHVVIPKNAKKSIK